MNEENTKITFKKGDLVRSISGGWVGNLKKVLAPGKIVRVASQSSDDYIGNIKIEPLDGNYGDWPMKHPVSARSGGFEKL